MTFFNKKEDVLEVELTQFGKQLLSKGDFEPYYYAFYDDDIIYDNQYAGLTNETGSNQNEIEVRIKDVPRTRTQYVYTGIETEIQKNNMLIRSGEIINQGKAVFVGKKEPSLKEFEVKNDRNFASYNSLGNSSLNSNNIPSWNVTMYKGEISNAVGALTSSATAVPKRIPQIDIALNYTISIQTTEETEAGKIKDKNINANNQAALDQLSSIERARNDYTIDILDFPDGTSIKVAQKQILLKIEEENVDFRNDNFEIEVFELTSSVDVANNKVDVMMPMYFQKNKNRPMEVGDTTYVEYFFDINVDTEIPERDICPVIQDERKEGNIYDNQYTCPDLEVIRRAVESGNKNLKDAHETGTEFIEEC